MLRAGWCRFHTGGFSRRAAVAGLCAVFLALGSGAAVAGSSVTEYRNATKRALVECGRSDAGMDLPGEAAANDCIRRAQQDAADRFSLALKSVESPSAKAALFRYREVFNEAMTGVQPRPGEPKLAYQQRQASSRHALRRAWSRFELAE
jgi:hypothetical protein